MSVDGGRGEEEEKDGKIRKGGAIQMKSGRRGKDRRRG